LWEAVEGLRELKGRFREARLQRLEVRLQVLEKIAKLREELLRELGGFLRKPEA